MKGNPRQNRTDRWIVLHLCLFAAYQITMIQNHDRIRAGSVFVALTSDHISYNNLFYPP
jgi:hypothetical protein